MSNSLINYPLGGTDGEIRTVLFGSPSPVLNILVTYDPDTDDLSVVVGNGPDHKDITKDIPEVLEMVASVVRNSQPELDEELAAIHSGQD